MHSKRLVAIGILALAAVAAFGEKSNPIQDQNGVYFPEDGVKPAKLTHAVPAETLKDPRLEGLKHVCALDVVIGADIVYDNGSEVAQTLPPLKASTEKDVVFNDVGYSNAQLAEDQQSIGWTVDVENCCTSYPIPLRLVVLRHGNVFRTFPTIQSVWGWMFVRNGVDVAVVTGPTHGPEVGDYRLYDVSTGKLISQVFGDEGTQSLGPGAPEWALRLRDHYHKR